MVLRDEDKTKEQLIKELEELRRQVAELKGVTSEKNRYEQEILRLDRLNLVGQLAAGIGHEVRNPMTAVRGFLQILESKQECKKYHSYFDLMIGELDRANSIISEFLSLARNKMIEKKTVNLNAVINSLLPLMVADGLASDKYINTQLTEVPDLLLDEKEIRQLVLNLVRNGLEATSPGGSLGLKTYSEGGDVVLAVSDQGKGMEPEVVEKIGTPFFTTKENGTGLGLATCYSIATRHSAAVEFETGPEGTTFLVRFKKL